MKKPFLITPTFAFVFSSLSLFAALVPSAHADESFGNGIGTMRSRIGEYGHPTISIQASGQSTHAGEMRGVIRVSYTSGDLERGERNCDSGWSWCGIQYFRASAELGVNLGDGNLSRFNIQVTPFADQDVGYYGNRIDNFELGHVSATREVAIGQLAKIRVDLLGASIGYQSEGVDSTALAQVFVNASAHVIGAQYLMAAGYGSALTQHYGAFDIGDAAVEVGGTLRFNRTIQARLTIGAQGDAAVGANPDVSARALLEARLYSRVSAILNTDLFALEAFAQGSAAAMQIGETASQSPLLSLEFGVGARM